MSILVRDPEIDRQVRALAKRLDCTLQEAIAHALKVEQEAESQASRVERRREATRKAQERFAALPKTDDGLTHKEFFDRENGDA
ncbi:MAG: type II toxin-antitoxin system VapB family antitoxin [Bosea sp. (in: a-proteobacteria)]